MEHYTRSNKIFSFTHNLVQQSRKLMKELLTYQILKEEKKYVWKLLCWLNSFTMAINSFV